MTLAIAHGAFAAPPSILLVGSSHSWGLKRPLSHIYETYTGSKPVIDVNASAGATLASNAPEALAEITKGPDSLNPYDHYDWVVLQENGSLADRVNWGAARMLRDAAVAAGGQALFYMTFPLRQNFQSGAYGYLLDRLINGSCAIPLCPPVGTPPACCLGYSTLANTEELNMRVAPVGQTIVDFHESPGHSATQLFGHNGYHLNGKGKYLAALTIFAAIERNLPEGVWTPGSLVAEAPLYKRIAREAVLGPAGDPRVWNLWAE